MALKYTYKGVEGNWHVWNFVQNGDNFVYTRHIQDESVRESLVSKYRSLGFTDKEIGVILGQHMLHGLEDFSLREEYTPE